MLEPINSNNSRPPEFKIILVGNSGVGKTCLVTRAAQNSFNESNPTIGFAFQKLHKQFDEDKVTLFIWDTAGFDAAQQLVLELKRNENLVDTQLILVGNKVDYAEGRKISKQTGQDYSQSQGITFVEVSAKTGTGVHDLFDSIAKNLISKHKQTVQRFQTQKSIMLGTNQRYDEQNPKDQCGGANELRPHAKGGHHDASKGWYEVKMTGKLPERRSYQISEIHKEYLYIFGGQDLKEGAYNSLWKLPLKHIMDGGTTSWEQVSNMSGRLPKPISHHSGFVYNDSLYVYGGLVESDSNPHLYALNLNTMVWTIVDSTQWSLTPPARDDHSACISSDNQMYVFGGYVRGGKSNDLWKYDLENNDWEELDKGDYFITDPKYHQTHARDRPVPRIGAAIMEHQNQIYLFGGHDEQNEKLDDFWKYDLATKQWQLIESSGNKPTGRNGHTMVLINGKLVMFGGILEITKETDDVFIYDFATNKWQIYELPSYYGGNSPMNARDTDSQHEEKSSLIGGGKSNTKKLKHTSSMPQLHNSKNHELNMRSSQKFSTNNNQSSIGNQLETTTTQKDGRRNSQPSSLTRKPTINITDQQFMKYMRGQETLSSPTSIQMKNAFILKNSNQSFEQYYLAMKKRRNVRNGLSINLSMSLDGGNSKSSHIQKNKPSARDGHSSFVFHDKMFIFGGDRHHMPFNDLFFLDIDI